MNPDNNQPQQLNVKEAIEQGYTHYGAQIDDFQHLFKLEEINHADFDEADPRHPLVLAEKTPHFFGVSKESLVEMISDDIINSDDYADDTNAIPDDLAEQPFWDEFADKINSVLKSHPYWFLTQIKLIP